LNRSNSSVRRLHRSPLVVQAHQSVKLLQVNFCEGEDAAKLPFPTRIGRLQSLLSIDNPRRYRCTRSELHQYRQSRSSDESQPLVVKMGQDHAPGRFPIRQCISGPARESVFYMPIRVVVGGRPLPENAGGAKLPWAWNRELRVRTNSFAMVPTGPHTICINRWELPARLNRRRTRSGRVPSVWTCTSPSPHS
jgi:hypothetical protein